MQIVVNNIYAHPAQIGVAHDCVQVCPVGVDQASAFMDQRDDFGEVALEQAQRVGVCNHQPGHVIGHQLLYFLKLYVAFRAERNFYFRKPAHAGGGRIGAVGGVGHQHFGFSGRA